MGLCWRGFDLLRCGILALLSLAERKYSFSLVRSGVSSTVFLHILSLVSIGLSIVAFTLNCLVVLTLGVGVSLATLGVGVLLTTLGVGVASATLGVGSVWTLLGAGTRFSTLGAAAVVTHGEQAASGAGRAGVVGLMAREVAA